MTSTQVTQDVARIIMQNTIMTHEGRYMLDVPGNGLKPVFMEDPYIRAQKWGGNMHTNMTDLQSSLRGLGQTAHKDCAGYVDKRKITKVWEPIQYEDGDDLITDQSRATDPAWTYREKVVFRFEPLLDDPQLKAIRPFSNNISTRVEAKNAAISRQMSKRVPRLASGSQV